ncbi:unnamed protein product [Echinostoma caproni]|uniref:BTB_2 domain-containing protein n=1 Tax=Echinostoma caproni TaxID=27848 RepID=A0A183B0H7_9TREM|nr:unnamed protein product [Echinostoma caproni]
MKQHYFIDRDGALFRFVLNFLRTGKVHVDTSFNELDQLLQESNFYELDEMSAMLRELQERRASHLTTIDGNALGKRLSKRSQLNEFKSSNKRVMRDSPPTSNHPIDIHPVSVTASIDKAELRTPDSSRQQCSCLWLEMDNISPYSGFVRLTRQTQKDTHSVLQNLLDYMQSHCKCTDHSDHSYSSSEESGCQWHELTRTDVLHLWQIILSHEYELCTKIRPAPAQHGGRDVYLFYRMYNC